MRLVEVTIQARMNITVERRIDAIQLALPLQGFQPGVFDAEI